MRSDLASLLSGDAISTTTGVYDPLSALAAERAGLDAVMLSGFSVAASVIGRPDFGLLTQTEIVDAARRTTRRTRLPVLVDGDTGHGGVANVVRLVEELLDVGAAGVFLEDQVWPKRCGHMRGKTVVAASEHQAKVRAAVDARGDAEFLIVGRTDARAPLGLDEAIRRGRMLRDAGADVVFVEAPESVAELERVRAEIDGPLLVNMVEGGATPIVARAELERMGFEIVVYPVTGILAVARVLEEAFVALARDGGSDAVAGRLADFEAFTTMLGLDDLYELERRYGADAGRDAESAEPPATGKLDTRDDAR